MSWFDTLNAEADRRMDKPESSLLNQERMERYIKRKWSDDFIKGQQDCEAGNLAKLAGSEAYQRGYGAQYQHEQNMSEFTK